MERMRSNKRVMDLEECCHPFTITFINGNCDKGVMIGINDSVHYYPLNKPVEVDEKDFFVLKDINRIRNFYNEEEYHYDPFAESI